MLKKMYVAALTLGIALGFCAHFLTFLRVSDVRQDLCHECK